MLSVLSKYVPTPFQEWDAETVKEEYLNEGNSMEVEEELWVVLRVAAVLLSHRENLPLDSLQLEIEVRSSIPLSQLLQPSSSNSSNISSTISSSSSASSSNPSNSRSSLSSSTSSVSRLRSSKGMANGGKMMRKSTDASNQFLVPLSLQKREERIKAEEFFSLNDGQGSVDGIEQLKEEMEERKENEEKKGLDFNWDKFCCERGWCNLDPILRELKGLGLIYLSEHNVHFPFKGKSSLILKKEKEIASNGEKVKKTRLNPSHQMVVVLQVDQIRLVQFFCKICKELKLDFYQYLKLQKEDLIPSQIIPFLSFSQHPNLSPSSLQSLYHSTMNFAFQKEKVKEEERSAKVQIEIESEMTSDQIEELLATPTYGDSQFNKLQTEIRNILEKPTFKERMIKSQFVTKGGPKMQEYCFFGTKEDCSRQKKTEELCQKVHFRRIMMPHTEVGLGDCSYLDTCRHMKSCKFVHYEIDHSQSLQNKELEAIKAKPTLSDPIPDEIRGVEEPQWINCDVRTLDMTTLGKFSVIMADPPWDIHMNLPYGTLSDDEMKKMNIGCLQDDGYLFLWVTGRAMELGRECLQIWGYERVEELVWVKTNQLQRIIRTGRTGHWLNHSKEHCLVGAKGRPQVNQFIDADVVVAEVRETSRKPDEIYELIERLSPGTRKLEIFGRMHNLHPGWVTLGNQLDGIHVVEPQLASFKSTNQSPENKK